MRLISAFCLSLVTLSQALFAMPQEVLQEKMLKELDVIKNTFEVNYAPAEWKKAYADWDLDEQIDIAKAKVLSTPNITIPQFQAILRSFFNGTKDYHVSVYFYSTEAAGLPFRVQGDGQGRYFLSAIEQGKVPSLWSVGDEVLSFGGQPIATAVEEIKRENFGNPTSLTDQGLAELNLTIRIRGKGEAVPRGIVPVTIRHASGKVVTYNWEWGYNQESISSGPYKPQAATILSHTCPKTTSPWNSYLLKREMSTPYYAIEKEARENLHMLEHAEAIIGSRIGFLPKLGPVSWQSAANSPFDAYIFKSKNNKNIGYIRIPTYMAGEAEAAAFAKILKTMQEKTVALVIDQTNNPGGTVFYMFALASMLSQKPLKLPLNRVALTQKDIFEAVNSLKELSQAQGLLATNKPDTLDGYVIDSQLADAYERYLRTLIDEWDAGRKVTQLIPMLGLEQLSVSTQAQYTKPILMLINHLDFSCADFFPAILRDNGRITTMGTTTAGAGGYLYTASHPNRFGIANYNFTGSIAERPGIGPIENLGVTPDIPYRVSTKDLQSNYVDYVKAINNAVDKLIALP